MKKQLLFALGMAAALPALAQQTQTRLLQKDYTMQNYTDNTSIHTSNTYRYADNGWLKDAADADGNTNSYEYRLNSDGYITRRDVYRLTPGGSKAMSERLERTLDNDNRTLKETLYRVTDQAGVPTLYKYSEKWYEYDSTPKGHLYKTLVYNENLRLCSANYRNDLGSTTVGLSVQLGNYKIMEVKASDDLLSYTTWWYLPSDSQPGVSYMARKQIKNFFSDGKIKEFCEMTFDESAHMIDLVEGYRYEVVDHPDTQMLEVSFYFADKDEDGYNIKYRTQPYEHYLCTKNVYYNLPETFENGNRYRYDYLTDTYTRTTWLAPNAVLKEESGSTPKVVYTADSGTQRTAELSESPDGTLTAYLNVNPYDDDQCNKVFVFNRQYGLERTVRFNRKDYSWMNADMAVLEEKDGDTWKPIANGTVGRDFYLYVTDDQGRIIQRQDFGRYSDDGWMKTSVKTMAYTANSATALLRYVYDDGSGFNYSYDEYVSDNNVYTLTHYKYVNDEEKKPSTRTVKERKPQSAPYDSKVVNYTYDSDNAQWTVKNGYAYQDETLPDGGYTSIRYDLQADGQMAVKSKATGKNPTKDSPDWYYYSYVWDSTLGKWKGDDGTSYTALPDKAFTYKEVNNHLERFYDPACTDYISSVPVCKKGDIAVTKRYAWNDDTEAWDVTQTEGYELSDDGRTLTRYKKVNNDETNIETYRTNADGLLTAEDWEYVYAEAPQQRNSLRKYTYSYDADGNLTAFTADRTVGGTPDYHQATAYTYGQVTTGISDALAPGKAAVGINGRTLTLSGLPLSLYNAAGQLVGQGTGQVTAPAPGAYILKSGNSTWKMVLK